MSQTVLRGNEYDILVPTYIATAPYFEVSGSNLRNIYITLARFDSATGVNPLIQVK